MSGGVDSSVAALLLKEKGYDIVGCFIKGWYPRSFMCDWKRDRRDAMRVCARLGVPFITIDAEKEYKREVVDYMISEYKAGRTPNPDVMCNKSIKFGVFLKKAMEMGADKIATGHYVRLKFRKKPPIFSARFARPAARSLVLGDSLRLRGDHAESPAEATKTGGFFTLLQAKDKNKDQSYFLWALTQEQLRHCLFPVGGLLKSEVRELAKKYGLPTAEKDESMGVCFIGEFDMIDFLKKYIKPKKGKVVTPDGKMVGEHEGVMFYTIGQRHGFGGGGGIPYYIVAKDIKNNLLIVADKWKEREFYKKEIGIEKVNWIIGFPPPLDRVYKARIRYRQPLQTCRILKAGRKTKTAKIKFLKPQRAATPGQSLVIYNGKTLLGGGIINTA